MGKAEPSVAVITGASQGIGAGLVDGYRDRGWSVVANARTMKPSSDPEVLVVDGDISEPDTADRIVDAEVFEPMARTDWPGIARPIFLMVGRIAVEKNGEIVPRSRYADTLVGNGDRIEIVGAVGGG